MHLPTLLTNTAVPNLPYLWCTFLAATADSIPPVSTKFGSSRTAVWQVAISSSAFKLDTKSCCMYMTLAPICRQHCHKESCADPLEQLPRQLHGQLPLSSSQHSTPRQTHHKLPSLPPLSRQQQPHLTLSSLQLSQAMVCNSLTQAGFRT